MSPQEFNHLFIQATNSPSRWVWAHGWCYHYAYCFLKMVGGNGRSYITKTNGGHAFIEFNGLVYDSENFDGVSNWKALQSYMNRAHHKKLIRHRSISGLLKTWKVEEDSTLICEEIIARIKELQSNPQKTYPRIYFPNRY